MEQRKQHPELRFPEFNGDWRIIPLGSIAEIYDGTHQTPKYTDEGVPFVSVENIDSLYDTDKYISHEDFSKGFKTRPQENDILMTRITAGVIGATAVVEDNRPLGYYVSLALIRAIGEVDVEFLNQAILNHWFKRELHKRIIHVAFPKKINLGDIGKCHIALTELPEQNKIASFFTAVDQKISKLKQKKNLLEQYKKGVMQKIFTQEIRFRDENGQEYPMWEKMKFNQIYSFKVTNSFSRDNLNYDSGEVKNIHYGDIHTKFPTLLDITNEEIPYVNSDIALNKIRDEQYCRTNDLVFADASEDVQDVGKCIELVNLNGEKVLAGLHTILARLETKKIAYGFAGILMKSIDVRRQIMKISQGSKVTSISSTRLGNIDLVIPCLEEQTKIAEFISAIDSKIVNTQIQIEKAELWKKGLLQKMFV